MANKSNAALLAEQVVAFANKRYPRLFCKPEELTQAVSQLACATQWRNEVEAFEYLAYVVNSTHVTMLRFGEKEREIWEPLLRHNFEANRRVLSDNSTPEYATLLSSYFPLPDVLENCQRCRNQIGSLMVMLKDMHGGNKAAITGKAARLCKKIMAHYGNVKGNEYLPTRDAYVIYKDILTGSLEMMVAMEKMQGKDPVQKAGPAGDNDSGNGNNTGSCTVKPAPKKPAPKKTAVRPQAMAAETGPAQDKTQPTVVTVRQESPKEQQAQSVQEEKPACRFSLETVKKVLNEMFDLDIFCDQFRAAEQEWLNAERNGEAEAAEYRGILSMMLTSFDSHAREAFESDAPKNVRKWHEADKIIHGFRSRYGQTLGTVS